MIVPTLDDVRQARDRISPLLVRTPLLHGLVDGRDVWFKAEVLQTTGSFKLRGALSFVSALDEGARESGVVAYSSGNHAQAVAAAAATFGTTATIVMPSDAPRVKRSHTERRGARVVPYERATGDREAMADAIVSETGATLIPPFDHPLTIAGQGVLGLEVFEDLKAAGVGDVTVVVPASGGGLAAGVALAAETWQSGLSLLTAEPDTHDDHRRSFEAGRRVGLTAADQEQASICDALLQPIPGEITFAVNRERYDGGVVASDAEVRAAMRFAFEELKLVVEPAGAIGLAALLQGRVPGSGPVVVVLSGGNVDAAVMSSALE